MDSSEYRHDCEVEPICMSVIIDIVILRAINMCFNPTISAGM